MIFCKGKLHYRHYDISRSKPRQMAAKLTVQNKREPMKLSKVERHLGVNRLTHSSNDHQAIMRPNLLVIRNAFSHWHKLLI